MSAKYYVFLGFLLRTTSNMLRMRLVPKFFGGLRTGLQVGSPAKRGLSNPLSIYLAAGAE
ncbi:hypothetical protein GCM10011585_21650 [Edaphobacter dinghuensis]|uniref:Uncharacterized protein n=1 Tax=Edaphobacter dinghuensis TaxID=1560005 RepID=A0A917HFX5_9BACT|nr:hypothetical protein GCM10011585_21650 [Edaphobacter dinghuensis]